MMQIPGILNALDVCLRTITLQEKNRMLAVCKAGVEHEIEHSAAPYIWFSQDTLAISG